MCFGACEHQHRTLGMRGADYAGFLKRTKTILESENRGKLRFEQITNPVRHSYSCSFVSGPDFLRNCNCSCVEVSQNRVRPQNREATKLYRARIAKNRVSKNYCFQELEILHLITRLLNTIIDGKHCLRKFSPSRIERNKSQICSKFN